MKLSAGISTTLVFVSWCCPVTGCTARSDDPWSTGQEVECCDGLRKVLENWEHDDNWHYKCVEIAPRTQTLMNKETQLCLEPAGPLDGVCSFHDIGMDFKQSFRFAECVEGSVQQQWIMEPHPGPAFAPNSTRIRPASNPEYCINVPEPYYGSVTDPDNHGDLEVWLCQCGRSLPNSWSRTDLRVHQGKNNSMVLEYDNPSGSYVIGSYHDDKFNADKVSLCYGGWDPDGGPSTCGTHWQAAGVPAHAEDMLQSEKGLDAVV